MDVVGFISDVATKLGNLALEEARSLGQVTKKVRSAKDLLESIKPVLEDAETTRNQSERTKHWVEEIRDIAERIEDAIDIYTVEVKANSAVNRHPHAANWLHRFCPCIKDCVDVMPKNPLNLISLHNLSTELDDIEETMKKIKEKKEMLGTPTLGESSKNEKLPDRPQTFPYIDEAKVIVGQEDDKRVILEELLNPQLAQLSVVSIVGIGGLGKTTLARSIFNSPKMQQNFSTRIWLCVPQYNKIDLLKAMLRKIGDLTGPEENIQDEGYFIEKIRSHLEDARYFIVLDDVWFEDFWPNFFKNACPDGRKGNRVLITTREKNNVAKISHRRPHELKFLSDEDSKNLLFKTAFPNQNVPNGLDEIANKLVKHCGGLPLALEVVGGLLYKKDSYHCWEDVAENLDWNTKGKKCMEILATSYNYMPIVLKKCFMYFASFPEDYRIDAKYLIWTWVAEGLAPDEITAKECLEELVQRSMVLVTKRSYDDSIEDCGIHDLLRDLAIKKAKESKFLLVFCDKNPDETFSDARRVSLQSCNFSKRDDSGNSNKKLRTLLLFGKPIPDYSGFKLLKVLKMHDCSLRLEGHKWFKELIQLRHLEFNDCKIEGYKIPEEICHFRNLQTLNCSGTYLSTGLPESMWSIKTLRHVISNYTFNLPPPSDDLTLVNLRTLGWDVSLEHPHGESYSFPNLCELGLIKQTDDWDPITAMLRNKSLQKLVSLTILGDYFPLDVVDMRHFVFFGHLQSLELRGRWSRDVCLSVHFFPSHLSKLVLFECEFTKDPMPELGKLQNLKILWFFNKVYMGKQLTCPAGGFPQLQQLHLRHLLKDLNIEEGTMPLLKNLEIGSKLKRIPDLQHLTKLEKFVWKWAPFSEEEIQIMRQENHHKLDHIRTVIINSENNISESMR